MSQIKIGQNTLLVPTIQWFEGAYTVDLHFSLSGGNRNLKQLLKLVMNVNSYNHDSWNDTWTTYFHILWSMFETKLDIGIEEELSSLDKATVKSFMLHLKCKERWDPNKIFRNSEFVMTPHAYYGLIKTSKFPTIRQQRRKSRVHFQQYIGVGYKDKGAAKVESEDGTPHWKAVSSYENNKSQEATLLSQSIRLVIKELDRKIVLLKRRKSIFDSQRKASFQRIYNNDRCLGYKLKIEPLASFVGFAQELDENEIVLCQNFLKTRISDGRYFFF